MYQMRKSFIYAAVVAALAICLGAGGAWAKDAVMTSIPAGGAPGALGIDENGNPLSSGTYAIGTLKLHYSDIENSWTPGEFANFTLNIRLKEGKPKPPTSYPADVHFRQVGSGLGLAVTGCVNVTNTAFTDSTLPLGGLGAEANCNVQVTIPTQDPAMNFGGALLVGNLQMETDAGVHLDTVTTVQVRVMLVFPTACLRLFNVITTNGVNSVVETYNIGAKTNANDISNVT
jgi:hypothetical protein